MKTQLFEKVPPKFLQGIFLAPHNFSSPQDPIHGQMVHAQLRADLYQQTFQKIQRVQFKSSDSDESYLKLQNIKQCDDSIGISQRIKDYYLYNKQQNDMIRCQEWSMKKIDKIKNTQVDSVYKLKFLHSRDDRFFSLVYPPRLFGYFKLWFEDQS